MKTRRAFVLTLLVLIISLLHATAQTEYFYYYGSQKMPLYLNEDKVVVSVSKTCNEISERIRANVQVLVTIRDNDMDIFVVSRSDYEALTTMDSWEEDAKSVIQTSCFYLRENKKAEVYESPYLNVCLKKEEDENLLNSYAEQYKLRIVEHMTLMPLWYILSVTPESGKSSLQCANELHESGDFAASAPDLAEQHIPDDETVIGGITNATPEKPSGIFDLQGRPVKDTPMRGIYVKDGRKVIK
jgi:hypothetical protein